MQPTSMSLLNLVRQEQDQEAWERLHRIYTPLIQGWLGRQDVVGAEVEDLAQEVMIVVMRKLPAFEHNGNVGAFRRWLRLIVVNCSRDFWKSKRIRARVPGQSTFVNNLNELAKDGSELTQKWNVDHDVFVMKKMLEQVRPLVKDSTWLAFKLTAIEEKNTEDVAAELGISTASVYAARSRVLAKLREISAEILD